ncbi:hypothetical protein H6768_03840 [Candidatus Peribacteria bacterium]|nr:hypothetical protein [Candidatus Peribacteria bacterium]
MPFVIFIAEDGTRLDVLNTNPMKIATSKREKDERTESPRFQELYKVAYDDSQKAPGSYPIDNKWLLYHGNLQLIPSFWVFDRNTGYWDNVGMRFVTPDPDAPYNIETLLYTTFVGKR